ncbi:MAG TPA: PPOX class F420-dependent oxidoreductase [Actinomycetota bacterium]|nr:PPOX class F420-dependent oxidoreductase [Actinomycetota bacterium]
MIPSELRDIFDKKAFAHVATIGPDGALHSSPVWVEFDGRHVRFSLTTDRQKYKNLKRDPRIAVSVIDPDNPYRYVEVRGRAERIDIDEGNAFINSMAKKYIDKDVYPWHRPTDQRVVVHVLPQAHSSMG